MKGAATYAVVQDLGKSIAQNLNFWNWHIKAFKLCFFVIHDESMLDFENTQILAFMLGWKTCSIIKIGLKIASKLASLFVVLIENGHIMTKRPKIKKGAGGMKLASDFRLPFSCFSSNLGNFSPIRVEMCYIWSSIKENVKKITFFLQILAYFDAKHSNFMICCT